jgi:rhamnulose-1-phosphate aldolase
LAHTVEKSAEILVKTLSMSPKKSDNYTGWLPQAGKGFGVTLPEKFLFEKTN